jgi:hypothetical protein
MTLLTKKEAEQCVKTASRVARIPATTKDVQAAVAGNKDVIVLLLKR